MQIFLHSAGVEHLVDMPEGSTVADLKARIEDQEFIPSALQIFIYSSTKLVPGLLAEQVPEAASVYLQIGVDGGMRAKWRKKRMRRLRRKRRKMRMRAR
jgi:small subunit ribosomal protein S27Ae